VPALPSSLLEPVVVQLAVRCTERCGFDPMADLAVPMADLGVPMADLAVPMADLAVPMADLGLRNP
jgi:hypothetical protein